MQLTFTKMHGLGNDFVFIDDRKGMAAAQGYAELARRLCRRQLGVGADGLILVLPSDTHDLRFRIFNADGSEAQMCGNGMRCFAKFVFEKGIWPNRKLRVETPAGTIESEIFENEASEVTSVRVDMGPPILETERIPFVSEHPQAVREAITVEAREYLVMPVSMGNPHAVLFVDDVDIAPVGTLGPQIETHQRFPERTNVEFVQVLSDRELKIRVWERGVGETLACGTGACAALVAAKLNEMTGSSAALHLSGGTLQIHWDLVGNRVFKTGPAEFVFEGVITL